MSGEKQIKKAYESILSHDFEQAIEWFEQAIALDPNNAAYHHKLSITYARSNKLTKALEHAELASQLDEGHEEYRFHFQNLQAKELIRKAEKCMRESSDQLYLAVSLLKHAISLDSLAIEAFLLLGLAYAGLNEFSQAIQAMKDVLKLDPEHVYAHKLLNEYEAKLKSYLQQQSQKGERFRWIKWKKK